MNEDRLLERLNQERITTRLQKQEIQKLEAQNNKLLKKLNDLRQQSIKREQEIQEEEEEIQQREAQVKENYASIKACLNGNINDKIQENILLVEELKTLKTLKEELEEENKSLQDKTQSLQNRFDDLSHQLTQKNNTISNLNMIIKLQSTRIEGFMTENAHHLEQNLKLNRLLEASSRKIAQARNPSHYLQRSINTFLRKQPEPTSSSLPTLTTHTLFDNINSSDKKAAKRPLDETFATKSLKSKQRATTATYNTPESSSKSNENSIVDSSNEINSSSKKPSNENHIIGSSNQPESSSAPLNQIISKSDKKSITYNSPESNISSREKPLQSPELGDSQYSYIDFEDQTDSSVLFDVSLSPTRKPLPPPLKQSEKPIVYLDDNIFDSTFSSFYKSKSLSPLDKEIKQEDTDQTLSQSTTSSQRRMSCNIQRRLAQLDEIQKNSSFENEIEKSVSQNQDENDIPRSESINQISTKLPLTDTTNISNNIQTPVILKSGPLNQLLPQVKNLTSNKLNMKPLTTKHQHGKDATCIACEKFYETGPLPDVGNSDNQITPKNRIQLHSRHKVRATTPPEFWDVGFPYTLSP